MRDACPLPSSNERRYGEIQTRIEDAMMRKVYAALEEATEQARAEIAAADLKMPPPSADYFVSVIHQSCFCTLCKADPKTFAGGRAGIAAAIIKNSQNIARHYWGATDFVSPQA